MYSGPYFYHQLARGQQRRVIGLLQQGIGDGIIIPVQTIKGISNNTFEKTVADCAATGKKVIFDWEHYDPIDFNPLNPHDGSEILLDPNIRANYVAESLQLQHANNCDAYIIPNFETPAISSGWYETIRYLGTTAQDWVANNGDPSRPIFLTLAIPVTAITIKSNCLDLLNNLTTLRTLVDGFYINIIGIPEILSDQNMFKSLLDFVFRLKRWEFLLILSKAGPWVYTMFPLGLDNFGSGGFKSQQRAVSRRGVIKGGGGRALYDSVWSNESMSYLRYPDDVETLYNDLPPNEEEHTVICEQCEELRRCDTLNEDGSCQQCHKK